MHLIDYKIISLIVMLIIYSHLWFLVYLKGKNRVLSTTFNIFTLFMCLWTASLAGFYAVGNNKEALVLIKMVYIFGGLIPPSFLLYSYAYEYGPRNLGAFAKTFLYLPYLALTAMYFFTDLMITKIIYIGDVKAWEFGSLHYIWEILFSGSFLYGFYRYLRIYNKSEGSSQSSYQIYFGRNIVWGCFSFNIKCNFTVLRNF